MPYGNFHLRDTTVQSILNNPKYGPKTELGTNMHTYLKFGLPRVLATRGGGGGSSGITPVHKGTYIKKWYFVTKIVLTYCEKKLF